MGNWGNNFLLYKNTSPDTNNWVQFKLYGSGSVNTLAIGSELVVTTSSGKNLVSYIVSGGSQGAGNSLIVHFGLGGDTVSNLQIRWPDGLIQNYGTVPVNQKYIYIHPSDFIFSNGF